MQLQDFRYILRQLQYGVWTFGWKVVVETLGQEQFSRVDNCCWNIELSLQELIIAVETLNWVDKSWNIELK